MNKEIKVLDHGSVILKEIMGTDATVTDAARVSYQDTKVKSTDRDLLRFLMRHRHTSPFEMCSMRFYIKAPIFVFRQWHRHRTAHVNEISARYSKWTYDVYNPSEFRMQSKQNKQGSSKGTFKHQICSYDKAYTEYCKLINEGVAKEQARIVLPVAAYSEMYWKCDLRNILHFLQLRLHDTAQWEIRQYAIVLAEKVKKYFPLTYEAFNDYTLQAVTFSRLEMETLKKYNDAHGLEGFSDKFGMTKREKKEFLNKVKRLGESIQNADFD